MTKPKTATARPGKMPAKAKEAMAEPKLPTEHVGMTLRRAREERGVTLDAVSDELMIRRFYLEALENGSFKDLPERVYASGFVKNYANYLGLQASSMVEQFKREAYGARNMNNYQVDLSMPEPVVHSVVPNRSAIISAAVVLVLIVIGIVVMTQDKKPSVSAIPEPVPAQESSAAAVVPPASPTTAEGDVPASDMPAMEFTTSGTAPAVTTTTTPAPAEATATVPATATAPGAATEAVTAENAVQPVATPVTATTEQQASATPAASDADAVPAAALRVKNRRVLEAMQSAWVEVRNDKGAILFTSILKAGQILPLPDNTRIIVTTGNAGGLRLIADGKPQSVFGAVNEVKRNIVLDPQSLDQR